MTVEHVMQLAPHEIVQAVVARHVALTAPRVAGLPALPSTEMELAIKTDTRN
jgi:hypothetical protein